LRKKGERRGNGVRVLIFVSSERLGVGRLRVGVDDGLRIGLRGDAGGVDIRLRQQLQEVECRTGGRTVGSRRSNTRRCGRSRCSRGRDAAAQERCDSAGCAR
jgi:hypothetical protein